MPESQRFVTGNTGIDAVKAIASTKPNTWYSEHEGRVVLLTTHRRENWGDPQTQIAKAALGLLEQFEDILLVVPMHRNPAVRSVLSAVLAGHPRAELIEPPDYAEFVKLMERSDLILTDSGGVQEEAPTFGIPVLVLRDTTERPEGVEAGTAKLVGTDKDKILEEASTILSSDEARIEMARAVSPYGDGLASARIRYVVLEHFGIASPLEAMWG